LIRVKQLSQMRPILEAVLSPVGTAAKAISQTGRPQHTRRLWESSWPPIKIESKISST
jgi:hypothetical protein